MSEDTWTRVDDFLNSKLIRPDERFVRALSDQDSSGLPSINVTATQGKFLNMLSKITGARRILEIGTLGGYSTMWLSESLPPEGTLLSLELSEKHAGIARKNLERAGLAGKVEIRVGNAVETLPEVVNKGVDPFDLIFIDADKSSIPHYFKWAVKASRSGTLIVVDNVIRNGKLIDRDSTDPDVKGVAELVEIVSETPSVESTAIQTVGSKGYDGFMIVRVL